MNGCMHSQQSDILTHVRIASLVGYVRVDGGEPRILGTGSKVYSTIALSHGQ